MNFREISITDIDNITTNHIIIDNGDGSFKSFPADESNPEYVAFLEQLAKLPEVKETPETPEAN